MIRSAAGAQYYAYWSISSGEAPEAVAARLLDAGWLDQARDHSGIAALLPVPGPSGRGPRSGAEPGRTAGRLSTAGDSTPRLTCSR